MVQPNCKKIQNRADIQSNILHIIESTASLDELVASLEVHLRYIKAVGSGNTHRPHYMIALNVIL